LPECRHDYFAVQPFFLIGFTPDADTWRYIDTRPARGHPVAVDVEIDLASRM
jgi:hypothetical protein